MEKLVNKSVMLNLDGINGNAYALMGAFRKAAQSQGWEKKEVELVLTEAQSSDYDHLLATLLLYCENEN